MMTDAPRRTLPPLAKLATDLGPLLVFFVANGRFGIYAATGAFMVAILASLAVVYAVERRLPTMPLVTAGFVLLFGGLTLWLQDETFIKVKVTLVNALFAAILLAGLARGRPLLKALLGEAFKLPEAAWRTLSLRWALFFLACAVLNEAVWRSVDTDLWVKFKVFGLLGLTILFTLAQVPFLQRNALEEEPEPEG